MISLKVNKLLLPMKGHYFLFNAGTGPVVPFMSVYAKQLGFSSVTVGIIYTILPLAGMFAKPIMGGIADRYHCKKNIFLIAILTTAVSFLLMDFAKSVPSQQKMRFACELGASVMDTCVNNFTVSDDCAVEKVTSMTGLSTVNCKLMCSMNALAWRTICTSWNASQYCNTTSNILSFSADIPMRHTEQLGNCVIFQIDKIKLENGQILNPFCPREENIQSLCDINCDSYAINDLVRVPTIESDLVYSNSAFWILLSIYSLSWVSQAVVVSISDAICFELLDKEPSKYGYQRLWGSLGWGTSSIISGYIIDFFSEGLGYKNYSPVFYLGITVLLINFINSYMIKYQQKHMSPNILKDVGHILSNLRVLVFTCWCIFVGICTGLIWNFLFWLVEDLAKANGCDSQSWIKTLQGLIMGIQCLCGEFPFFFFSGWILKRIGHANAMNLVVLVLGIKFTFYSIIPNPWWFLPLEVSNGLTYGLFYATMASYASIVAPRGTEATVQGLVGAVFEGIGVSLGSFIGGILFNKYEGPMTFRIMGIAAFIVCLLHAVIEFWLERRNSQETDIILARYANPREALQMMDDDQQELK